MAQKRVQYNSGPGVLDLVNFVPGAYFTMRLAFNHDLTDSAFESPVYDQQGALVTSFSVSGVAPLASGICYLTMDEDSSALITGNTMTWRLNEIQGGHLYPRIVGNIEEYLR